MREFLKRKNIIFSAKRYGIDALGAMAQGLFCTLLVGTILNTIGQQFHIGFLTQIVATINGTGYTIGGLASAMVGPGIAIAIGYLTIIALGEPFMCVEIVSSGAISGLGNTKLCSMISIIFTSSRIPLAYFLSQHTTLGLKGIWWALTITSVCKGIVFFLAFHKEHKKRALD